MRCVPQGRAETARLALTIGEIPFEDERLSREQWIELKPNTPYGSVPIATVNDRVFAQSNAILRYCGKIAGLYPEDPEEAMFVDEVIDVCEDAVKAFFSFRTDDKEALKAHREKMVAEDFPRYWGGVEKRLGMLGDGTFVLGEKMTIADIFIYVSFGFILSGSMEFVDASVVEKFEKLMKVYQAIRDLPKVEEYTKLHYS